MTKIYDQITVRKLVDQNKALRDSHKLCNNGAGSAYSCKGVHCGECPFRCQSDKYTLGDVRRMDNRPAKGEEPACQACLEKDDRFGHTCAPAPQRVTPKVDGSEPKVNPKVVQPGHYMLFEGIESIQVIARSMTEEQFKGFCLGNTLKYRLRAGKKSDLANVQQDLEKAEFYKTLFEKHRGECHVAK